MPSLTAISVGLWQVRVMRQVSTIQTNVRSSSKKAVLRITLWAIISLFGYGMPLFFIYTALVSEKTVSRGMIFIVALNFCLVFSNVLATVFIVGFGKIIKTFESQMQVNEDIAHELEKHESRIDGIITNSSQAKVRKKQ